MIGSTGFAAVAGDEVKLALVINDSGGGGAEKVLTLLSGYAASEGVMTRVYTLQPGNDSYELDPRVERVVLPTGRMNRGVGRILGLPLQAADLAHQLRKWQPDVCVSFLPRSNIAHVMTRWFGSQHRLLISEHAPTRDAYPSDSISDRVMRSMIARFYPQADEVFTCSEGVKEGLARFGVDRDRMRVVYNPISLSEIHRAASASVPGASRDSTPTVITVGRLAHEKDHDTLLRAFAITRRRLKARLVLVGQGPLREELKALARELGISDSVVFAGWQENPFAWMANADLFVLSSRFEGFGNVVIEAMACGLPVVSTDCPSGPSEILANGEAGVLVPVADVHAMADAICAVLEDDELREQLADKSQRRAPEFDISLIGRRYLERCQAWSTEASR
jgi:glycosyltransferase involved in cell wall biosynthesis